MPNWSGVLKELSKESSESHFDRVRRQYLRRLSSYTRRNVIAYYSGWLQKNPRSPFLSIGDDDKNAFMTTIHGLDRTRGLDLILHTPGGDVAATESLVHYLRSMFGTDIRALVPQIALSAGTMISCACSEIWMGKESSLGPIDPQFGGVPAHGVIAEFEEAVRQVQAEPASLGLWQAIIGKYHPTFLGECRRAIDWSKAIVTQWLATGMLSTKVDPAAAAAAVVDLLSDHETMKTHSRHISVDECEKAGLNIKRLESDPKLQDLVLTVHHAYMHTLSSTSANKIIENHKGVAMVTAAATAMQVVAQS